MAAGHVSSIDGVAGDHARHEHSGSRGRHAREPREIPARGWWDILTRVWNELGSDHVTLVSAGLAMYALLAVFPDARIVHTHRDPVRVIASMCTMLTYGLRVHSADVDPLARRDADDRAAQ